MTEPRKRWPYGPRLRSRIRRWVRQERAGWRYCLRRFGLRTEHKWNLTHAVPYWDSFAPGEGESVHAVIECQRCGIPVAVFWSPEAQDRFHLYE